MSIDQKQNLDMNSAGDTQNRKAGNPSGQALKDADEKKEPADENLLQESTTPLFMRDSSEGKKGNAQDEKDETEE